MHGMVVLLVSGTPMQVNVFGVHSMFYFSFFQQNLLAARSFSVDGLRREIDSLSTLRTIRHRLCCLSDSLPSTEPPYFRINSVSGSSIFSLKSHLILNLYISSSARVQGSCSLLLHPWPGSRCILRWFELKWACGDTACPSEAIGGPSHVLLQWNDVDPIDWLQIVDRCSRHGQTNDRSHIRYARRRSARCRPPFSFASSPQPLLLNVFSASSEDCDSFRSIGDRNRVDGTMSGHTAGTDIDTERIEQLQHQAEGGSANFSRFSGAKASIGPVGPAPIEFALFFFVLTNIFPAELRKHHCGRSAAWLGGWPYRHGILGWLRLHFDNTAPLRFFFTTFSFRLLAKYKVLLAVVYLC